MAEIINPILKGFNPDPSIIRVGDDYFIATSTFEWFPGVQIHHSQDLINWRLVKRPLEKLSQLNMKGNLESGGVWAPCLTYHDGVFYLVYTDVKHSGGIWKDTHNYLVMTDDIYGEWSEPIYLNSSGFDPSLFHDDDGRKWLVNLVYDHRKDKNTFGGILLQEYCPEEKRLVGPIKNIFRGTELGFTEGPHLYKKDGYYYLLTAEGGTWYDHAVTIARSRNIDGPYEVHPENPILTSKGDLTLPLQRAGHADLVETRDGEWYMVHLCSRPLEGRQRSILGRETAIQKIEWRDGWPYLVGGGNRPALRVPAPDLPERKWEEKPARDDFDNEELDMVYQTLRIPLGEDQMTLKERPGYLRLKGAETLSSLHRQSLVARRQEHLCYTATTCLEFEPETFQQMAGLVCYYNTQNWYYLKVSWDEEKGKSLGILSCDRNDFDEPMGEEISLEGVDRVYLRVMVDYDKLQFYYSTDEKEWQKVGPVLDASILSDEYATYDKKFGFTGAFVGICCQDLTGRRKVADFDYFEYTGRDE